MKKIQNVVVSKSEVSDKGSLWLQPNNSGSVELKYYGASGWSNISGGAKNIVWTEISKLSDYLEPGIYVCQNTKRYTLDDELPILNVWSEEKQAAYISFTLIVNKAVSFENPPNKYERIGQTLILTNRAGNETKQYIRTLKHEFNSAVGEWNPVQEIEKWKELKGVTNLNVVSDDDLKSITENGTYEGVVNNGDTSIPYEEYEHMYNSYVEKIPTGIMFKMEVQNNYAVIEALNAMGFALEATVVQTVRCVGPSGTVSRNYRVLKSNKEWTSWRAYGSGGMNG